MDSDIFTEKIGAWLYLNSGNKGNKKCSIFEKLLGVAIRIFIIPVFAKTRIQVQKRRPTTLLNSFILNNWEILVVRVTQISSQTWNPGSQNETWPFKAHGFTIPSALHLILNIVFTRYPLQNNPKYHGCCNFSFSWISEAVIQTAAWGDF